MRELTLDECEVVAGGADDDPGRMPTFMDMLLVNGQAEGAGVFLGFNDNGMAVYQLDRVVVSGTVQGTGMSVMEHLNMAGFALAAGGTIGGGWAAMSYLSGTAGMLSVGEAMAVGACLGGVAGLSAIIIVGAGAYVISVINDP